MHQLTHNAHQLMQKIREALADDEHRRWARWMEYLFSKCTFHYHCQGAPWETESVHQTTASIPAELVARWRGQCALEYANLSETEKDSDRKEADRIIELLKSMGVSLEPVRAMCFSCGHVDEPRFVGGVCTQCVHPDVVYRLVTESSIDVIQRRLAELHRMRMRP